MNWNFTQFQRSMLRSKDWWINTLESGRLLLTWMELFLVAEIKIISFVWEEFWWRFRRQENINAT